MRVGAAWGSRLESRGPGVRLRAFFISTYNLGSDLDEKFCLERGACEEARRMRAPAGRRRTNNPAGTDRRHERPLPPLTQINDARARACNH